jgi:RNA polymerase sigma-70 factor (ECF subfamily)
MRPDELENRLSHITTLWTLVHQAHTDVKAASRSAQEQLLQRYSGAVYRYLLASVRDPHTADELFQDFSLRFLRGDFRRADPGRGRFRDLVKTALCHLIIDHQRRQKSRRAAALEQLPEPAVSDPSTLASDRQFLDSWREALLDRAWSALAAAEQETGQPFFTVLRFRAEHPGLPSPRMAEQLAASMGRSWSAEGLRQVLHRARTRFAEVLLNEVSASLDNADREAVERELDDLGLLTYCRSALAKRRLSE